MLNIQRFVVNPFQENCYVIYDETKEAVIIDCGAFYPEERSAIVKFICDNELSPRHLIATHFYGAYVKAALATQLIVLYNATGQYLTA